MKASVFFDAAFSAGSNSLNEIFSCASDVVRQRCGLDRADLLHDGFLQRNEIVREIHVVLADHLSQFAGSDEELLAARID